MLNEKTIPELKAIAVDLGIDIKGNLSKETLIERITKVQATGPEPVEAGIPDYAEERKETLALEKAQAKEELAATVEADKEIAKAAKEAEKEIKVKPENRAAFVEHLVAEQRAQGLRIETDDVSWTMSYGQRTVSGSLTMPDSKIKLQASLLVNRG